jgi:predicted esterase
MDMASTIRFQAIAVLASLVFSASSGTPTHGRAQQQTPGHGEIDASLTYSLSGPALLRISGGRELAVILPKITDAPSLPESDWRLIYRLTDTDWEAGWRLRQTLCDSARTNLCVLERSNGDRSEWARIDVAAASVPSDWRDYGPIQLLDLDSASASLVVRRGAGEEATIAVLGLVDAARTVREIWRADPLNANAHARFLPPQGDARPILLMTGGSVSRWRIVGGPSDGVERTAPGRLNSFVGRTAFFVSTSSDGTESWLGYSQIPIGSGDWDQDALVYQGGPADNPTIYIDKSRWRFWTFQQPAGVLARGAFVAVTRENDRLSLSEICRSTAEATTVAMGIDTVSEWLSDARQASLHGGRPGSHMLILSKTDLAGNLSLTLLIDGSDPDAPAQAVRNCGETPVAAIALPLPESSPPLDVMGIRHEAIADDGTAITYDVIGDAQRGRIMIRPYGAYGITPQPYLARPFERAWVAQGNALVVPRLRGDEGEPGWISAGQGRNKQRTVDDLIAVAEDLGRRYPAAGRLDLVGMSAGGFVAARTGLARPELFDRIILISAVLDLSLGEAGQTGSLDHREFGPSDGTFATWFRGVPAVEGQAPRFILLHGSRDDLVPLASTTGFAEYVRSLGYQARGLAYPTLGHELADDPQVWSDFERLSQ